MQKAIELEPAWDQLYFGLGLTLLQLKRFDDAISALRTAVQKEPGNVFSMAALIYGLGPAGQKKEAKPQQWSVPIGIFGHVRQRVCN